MAIFGQRKDKIRKPVWSDGSIYLKPNGQLVVPDDYVDAHQAIRNSDVFAIVHLLSSDLASVSYACEAKQVDQILETPNRMTNRYTFFQTMFAQLLLTGNAYARIYKDVHTGRIDELEYLSPSQVSVFEEGYHDDLWYDIQFPYSDRPDEKNVPGEKIIHVRLASTDGKIGTSPILSLQADIRLQEQNRQFTKELLREAFGLRGVIEINRTDLETDSKKETKQLFMETVQEDGVGILDQFMKFHPLEARTDIGKLLNASDWTSAQIAKVYGIPKDYLGSESEHSNMDMVANLYTTALARYIRPMVSELRTKLGTGIAPTMRHVLDMDGQVLEHRVADLVQKSVITPAVAQEILLQSHTDLLTQDVLDAVKAKGESCIPPLPLRGNLKGGETNGIDRGNALSSRTTGDESEE